MTYKITIGCDISALEHAYQNNTKIILNNLHFPAKYEPEYLKNAWGLLYTKLMLDGQVVGGDTVQKIKINPDSIQIVGEHNIVNKITYETIFIFDDKNIIGLPEVVEVTDEYKIVDVLKAVSLVSSSITHTIFTKDALVEKLHIIKKTQNSPIEVYSISHLLQKQLTDFNYSDTMVKFKSEDLLKKNDFVGRYHRGNSERAPIELKVVERRIQKKMDLYKDIEKIKFFYGRT